MARAAFRAALRASSLASFPSAFGGRLGRLAGYEDVNDADRLSQDPVMRAIVDRCSAHKAQNFFV